MTHSAPAHKVLLVAGRRVSATNESPVRRRFRLARAPFDGRPAPAAARPGADARR